MLAGGSRGWIAIAGIVLLLLFSPVLAKNMAQEDSRSSSTLDAQESAPTETAPRAIVDVDSEELTIGTQAAATIRVPVPTGRELVTQELGPRWGDCEIVAGGWLDPDPERADWIWQGTVACFQTGTATLSSLRFAATGEPSWSAATEPVTLEVLSVLEDAEPGQEGEPAQIAGIKDPVGVLANFSPLIWAVGALLLLILLSLLFWWIQRRYGEKWRRVPVKVNIFDQIAPHDWVYAELQKLLEQRLPERGEIDGFYSELSRILKQYLGARFRVDLMERTTSEVSDRLAQGGAGRETLDQVDRVLQQCDAVKFAGSRPESSAWKSVVEEIYRIVDLTRPASTSEAPREEVAS